MRRLFVIMFILAGSLACWSQTFSANATSIDFGGDPVGGAPVLPAGPERTIVITNTGTAALTISAIQESGEFFIPISRFPPLPIQVNPGQTSPEIPVDFVPTAAGPRSGSMSFTDNAADSPQTISFTGVGLTTDFSLAVANIPASSTVTAGQTAGYELDENSAGAVPCASTSRARLLSPARAERKPVPGVCDTRRWQTDRS